MSEYISKEEAIEAFSDMSDGTPITHGDMISDTTAVNVIKSIPSADVRPNIHGHWEDGNNICPKCGENKFKGLEADIYADWQPNFCPNCGADMREPKGEKGTE